MMKLGCRCTVQKSWLSLNLGVIAPSMLIPKMSHLATTLENRRRLSSFVELFVGYMCRIIQDYVLREEDYTLRPSATSTHSNKVNIVMCC